MEATKARSYLKAQIAKAKQDLKEMFLDKGVMIPPIHSSLPACSSAIDVHYSFDFAQQVNLKEEFTTLLIINIAQVHIPNLPQQPGPMYFLTPRKCGLFGVNCEAIPRQVGINVKLRIQEMTINITNR